MSADNWTFCPRCIDEKRLKIEKLEIALDKGYGKLSKEEWLDKRKILHDLELEKDEPTLREDYEIWMEGRESPPCFSVQYSCSCSNCGFEHSLTHEEEINIKEEK